MTPRASVLASALALAGVFGSAACSSEAAPAPTSQPKLVDMAQLDAEVKQNLGRGCLVNVWATY